MSAGFLIKMWLSEIHPPHIGLPFYSYKGEKLANEVSMGPVISTASNPPL